MSRARRTPLRVIVTDARGRPIASRGLAAWLQTAAPKTAKGAVSIALVSDATMRRLNREYRGVDKATDVLSFPQRPRTKTASAPGPREDSESSNAGARASGGGAPRALKEDGHLGDLAIALGVARRQAQEHGHLPYVEWRILALHGLLHLLGYDHETDRGQMRRVEERLRRRAGLPTGLVARVSGAGHTR